MSKKTATVNPLDWVALAFQQQRLAMGAGETILRRGMMMGTGSMGAVEAASMWFEKPAAFAKGFEKAATAMAGGKPQAQVMTEFLRPIAASAASNAERLRK